MIFILDFLITLGGSLLMAVVILFTYNEFLLDLTNVTLTYGNVLGALFIANFFRRHKIDRNDERTDGEKLAETFAKITAILMLWGVLAILALVF